MGSSNLQSVCYITDYRSGGLPITKGSEKLRTQYPRNYVPRTRYPRNYAPPTLETMYPVLSKLCTPVLPKPGTQYSRNHAPYTPNSTPCTLETMHFHKKFGKRVE